MTFLRCGAGLVAVMFAGAGTAWSQTPAAAAGRIKISSGQASIVREGKEVPAKAGELVYQADVLKTGADGRLGVTLRDESQISLGPTSEVRVDRFVYAPAEGNLGMALRIARGIVAYVSGRIAKLAPDAVRLETPAAIVGVRGTRLVIQAGSQAPAAATQTKTRKS
jgi:hypothetical protein